MYITRKYPLRGYILCVLTHTTAWDQHWGGDEHLKDPRGLKVTQNAYFSLMTRIKKLLLVTFCDQTAKPGVSFQTHERMNERNGWTDRGGG